MDLWFQEDVARILASAHETMRSFGEAVPASSLGTAPEDRPAAVAYRQGFEDALRAVGVAFGVIAPSVHGQRPRTLMEHPSVRVLRTDGPQHRAPTDEWTLESE